MITISLSELFTREAGSASIPIYGMAGPWRTRSPNTIAALHETSKSHDSTRLWTHGCTLQVTMATGHMSHCFFVIANVMICQKHRKGKIIQGYMSYVII